MVIVWFPYTPPGRLPRNILATSSEFCKAITELTDVPQVGTMTGRLFPKTGVALFIWSIKFGGGRESGFDPITHRIEEPAP
jgi:hypothetical protein